MILNVALRVKTFYYQSTPFLSSFASAWSDLCTDSWSECTNLKWTPLVAMNLAPQVFLSLS